MSQVSPYPLMNRMTNISLPLNSVMLNQSNVEHLIQSKHAFLATWLPLSSLSQSELETMATNEGTTSYNPEADDTELT